jgi:DNA-binding Xre family transcriptional regulator
MSERTGKSEHRKVGWTAEDRARHKAAREKFQAEKPGLEDLLASGEYEAPVPLAAFLAVRQLLREMRQERERQGLSLADLAERTGMDKAALSRLETGRQANPTVDTLLRYASAIGKHIKMTLADAPAEAK